MSAEPNPGGDLTPDNEQWLRQVLDEVAHDAGDLDLDTGKVAGAQLVDSVEAQTGPGRFASLRHAEWAPILPRWARSATEARAAFGWAAAYTAHTTAYHLLRVPKYAVRLLWRAPRGAYRALAGWFRWLLDLNGEPVRQAAVRREDAREYLTLTRTRDAHVRWRGIVTTIAAVLIVPTVVVGVWLAPVWGRWAGLAVLICCFGLAGRPADKPLLDTAVVKPTVLRLTSDVVLKALGALGIGEINQALKRGGQDWFPAPITRDGAGWRADVNLPLGVTAEEVIDRRPKLASGLRRPLGCVWPEPDSTVHEGRLVLWVGDEDLSKLVLSWGLAKASRHDLFKGIPFGADPRGRPATVPLNQHNVIIGANPGQGKTGAVRVIGCGVALDPTAELWVHELLGKGDLAPLGKVAGRYTSGVDDDSLAYAAESMRLLKEDVARRSAILSALPADLCPDNQITRTIANKPSVGLRPLVAIFDEVQNLFTHNVFGPQATADAEFIIRSARAGGIILVLATQRPAGAALPPKIRDLASVRFCLSVEDHTANDMILGSGAYKSGLKATMFRPEIDAGIGYLKGASPAPTVVRTAYLDRAATEKICDRARATRIAAGTLSGYAAGEAEPAPPAYNLIDDILAVTAGENDDKVWSEVIVERLAALRPHVYTGWGSDQLAAALKPHGIDTTQIFRRVNGEPVNKRGIDRRQLTKKTTRRDQPDR